MPRASSRNGTPVPMDIDAKSDGSSVSSEKAQTYAIGQHVEAKHMAQQVGSFAAKWYSGVVRKVHENGACDVLYDDGDKEDKVPLKFLRKAKAAAPVKEQQPAAASSAASDDDNDEPDEPISQGRGKRKIVPTTCMVDGFAVKRQNMYDLDEGEGSVPHLWLRIVTGLASEQRAVSSAGGFRGSGRPYARSSATSAAPEGLLWPPVASRACAQGVQGATLHLFNAQVWDRELGEKDVAFAGQERKAWDAPREPKAAKKGPRVASAAETVRRHLAPPRATSRHLAPPRATSRHLAPPRATSHRRTYRSPFGPRTTLPLPPRRIGSRRMR